MVVTEQSVRMSGSWLLVWRTEEVIISHIVGMLEQKPFPAESLSSLSVIV